MIAGYCCRCGPAVEGVAFPGRGGQPAALRPEARSGRQHHRPAGAGRPGDRPRAAVGQAARGLDRLAGHPGRRTRADHRRRRSLSPHHAVRGRGRRLLRGFLQRHALAAVPRRRRRLGVPPAVVGRLPEGQPAVRRGRRRRCRSGLRSSGCTTTNCNWCPQMLRRLRPDLQDRLLPAHPVPAGRAVHAAAAPRRDHHRAARRRPGRIPTARRRPELRQAGPPADRGRGQRRNASSTTAGPFGPPPSRSPSTPPGRPNWPGARTCEPTRPAAARGSRQPAQDSSSASIGWTTPRASTSGCGRSANCWPRATRPSRTPSWCRSPPRAGSGWPPTCSMREADRAAGRRAQRRLRPDRPPRRALPAPVPAPRGTRRVLRRRRRDDRDAAAGRDEPGRQGIRRLPGGRRRSAAAVRVHRRRPGAALRACWSTRTTPTASRTPCGRR